VEAPAFHPACQGATLVKEQSSELVDFTTAVASQVDKRMIENFHGDAWVLHKKCSMQDTRMKHECNSGLLAVKQRDTDSIGAHGM
jgi:hypothetical protein